MINAVEYMSMLQGVTNLLKDRQHCLESIFIALIYASILTNLPLMEFLDRDSYLIYANFSRDILDNYYFEGFKSVIFNEPIWLWSNIALREFFSGAMVMRAIIFIGAFGVSLLVLLQNQQNLFWAMVFLLVPQVLKNHIVHLRQGLGLAVFLSGYFSPWRSLGLCLMIISCFVHSSLFFIVLIIASIRLLGYLPFSPQLRIVSLICAFSIGGMVIVTVSSWLGARQAELYSDFSPEMSGRGLLLWGIVLGLFLLSGRAFLQANMVSIAIVIFYITNYFAFPAAARVFESGTLLVMMSGLGMTGWRRRAFLMLILTSLTLQYALRYDRPWMGWGVPL